MEKKSSKFSVHDIVAVGLMAALVFVSNYVQFKIPTPLGETRFHIANGICLLSALLFGKVRGGLSAGIGSFLYDLTNPKYISTSWITFINKFLMAFVAGLIIHGGPKDQSDRSRRVRTVIGTACGALTYIFLYTLTNFIRYYFVQGQAIEAVSVTLLTNLGTSLVNGLLAVILSVLLGAVMKPALKRSGLSGSMGVK